MAQSNGERKCNAQVIIVGAGPVGMLTALRLGQAGVDTLVIEGHDTLLNTTRAVVYMPVVIPVLRQLGVLDSVMKNAFLNTQGVTWRDMNGKPLANLPLSSDSKDIDGVLMLGQANMNALVQEELKNHPSATVRFGLKLVSLQNDPSSPTVTLTARDTMQSSSPEVKLTANFVLGTDGANSTTRRLLDVPYTGMSYDSMRMIGIDVLYDFIHHENYTPLNFAVHPKDWAVIAYTGQNGAGEPCDPTVRPTIDDPMKEPQWRVAYVEDPSLPADQSSIWERAEAQMSKYAHSGKSWKLIRAEPYNIGQRCADAAIVHRVALAGDALHSNNPIGGLGLTGGILDSFCYGNALIRVLCGGEPESVLTQCAESRLKVWKEVTDGLSRANLERLHAEDGSEAGKAREGFFQGLNGEARTTVAGKARSGFEKMMEHDFSEGTEKFVHASK